MLINFFRTFTKTFRLLAVCGLLITLLAACGESTPTSTTTVSVVSNTSPSAKPASRTTTAATPTKASSVATANTKLTPTAAKLTVATTASPTPKSTASVTKPVSGTVGPLPSPTPLTSESLRSFLNAEFGMAYPSDWQFSTNTGGRFLFESTELGYGVSVDVTTTVSGESATNTLQNFLLQLATNNQGFQIITTTVGTGVGGTDAAGALVLLPDPNDKQGYVEAYIERVLSGPASYTLIASSNAKDYAAHEPSLQICLNSFAPLVLPNAGKNITDTVTYQDNGLSFKYPKDWQLDNTASLSPGAALTIYNPQYPDVKADLFVESGSDPATYNTAILNTLNQGAADARTVPYPSVKISDTVTLQRSVVFYISGSGYPIYKFIDTYANSKTNTLYSIQTSSIAVHYLIFSDELALIENTFKPS